MHDVRRLGHRVDHVVGEVLGVRAGEAHPLEPLDLAAGPQQLAERLPVAELDAVRVDVLPEQGDLEDALGDQRLDLGEDRRPGRRSFSVPRSDGTMQNVQVLLQPTEIETQAAYAESRRVGSVDGKTSSDSRISTCASSLWRARSSSTGSEPMLCVPKTTSTHGARRVISPRSFCARQPPTAICMPGRAALTGAQLAEVAVEPVVGVLAHRAGVEHDDVGRLALRRAPVARVLEQAGQPLGVVHVHLAPEGADLVAARARP